MADEATQGRAPDGPRDDLSGNDVTETDGHEQLEALREEAAEHWNKYLRACAELDNLRKRNAREVEHARRFGAERLAQAILPVRDSLEAGLATADGADTATLLEGARATLRLLDDALRSAGLAEIDPLGEPFDPARHEAMTVRPTDEVEPNTVVDVIQKGYEIHERVIRPARVIVSQPVQAE
jgi:molecular chaperone GrpE